MKTRLQEKNEKKGNNKIEYSSNKFTNENKSENENPEISLKNEIVEIEDMFLQILDDMIEKKKDFRSLCDKICRLEQCVLVLSTCIFVMFTSHFCTSHYFGQIL